MTATGEQQGGIRIRRSWPVWANRREHRVEVHLNQLTGSLRIEVDGEVAVRRSGWKMGINAAEIPFDVEDRPCLLVVRQRYGHPAGPEVELYSEGRSLTTGELLEDHRQAQLGRVPNLVSMMLIFLPLIAVPSALRGSTSQAGQWQWIVIGAGVALAAIGGLAASAWYRRAPGGAGRHLVGGAIVLAAYLCFFGVFLLAFSQTR